MGLHEQLGWSRIGRKELMEKAFKKNVARMEKEKRIAKKMGKPQTVTTHHKTPSGVKFSYEKTTEHFKSPKERPDDRKWIEAMKQSRTNRAINHPT